MAFILPTKPYQQCQVALVLFPETIRAMGTGFQPKDFWDCLGGQVLPPCDWLMVAMNTMDQSQLMLVHQNYPRTHCSQSFY